MNRDAVEITADIIDSNQIRSIVQAYLEKPQKLWQYCNEVLYRMCKEQPLHNNIDIVAGKLIIIGRTYAAAVERRKTKDDYSNDDFYYQILAEKMESIHDELDRRIANLKNESKPTKDNIGEVISTHKYLVGAFRDLTGDIKRSLASKYLHFHCPNMFYIYDSRAESSIKKLVKKNSSLIKILAPDGDEAYADFAVRCLEIQEFVQADSLTPRDIDNILLSLTTN